MKNRYHLHVCAPWSGDCAMGGIRLNIWLGRRFITLALTPEGRVLRGDKWVWLVVEDCRHEDR